MDQVAYRLTSTGSSSDKYGPCECCGKHVADTHLLAQGRRYTRHDGSEGITHHNCITKFGHKDCLAALT